MTLDAERIDWSATGTMAAAIIALASLGLSIWSLVVANHSANSAKRVADAEVDRRHGELDPRPRVTFSIEPSSNRGGQNLFASLTVESPCRIVGVGVGAQGERHPLAIPLPVKANVPVRFHVEDFPEGREDPNIDHLLLRLWTPARGDDVTQWACPCSRPAQHVDDRTAGHWEHTIRIKDIERETQVWAEYQ